MDGYIDKLRKDGKQIQDRSEQGKPWVIDPDSINVVFPEFAQLIDQFQQISKKYSNGRVIPLQISVLTKYSAFEANPWDFEVEE